MKNIAKIAAIIALSALPGCDKEPTTYEDCLLKYSARAQSDKAAQIAASACSRKFPQENPFNQFDQKPGGR